MARHHFPRDSRQRRPRMRWRFPRNDDHRRKMPAGTVRIFATLLRAGSALCRRTAAAGLGRLGRVAAPALPRLRVALRDPSRAVRRAARRSVRAIGADRRRTNKPGAAGHGLFSWLRKLLRVLFRSFRVPHA